MRGSRKLCALVVAAAVLATVPAVRDAVAGRKPKLVARINGKKFKANVKPSITGVYYTSAGVTLNGLGQKISIGRGTIKNLVILCGGIGLPGATFPVTVDCGGTYTDNTFSGPVPPANAKAWAATTGILVTFQSFDGTRAKGTFAGSLPPGDTNPGDPPATIERGKFSVDLIFAGA
jgi:hypothetical protein